MKQFFASLTFLVGIALASTQVLAQRSIDEAVSASPDGTVNVSNISGSVTVIGSVTDKVTVTGTIGPGVERVDVLSAPGTVDIKVVIKQPNINEDSSAYLTIRVPEASHLAIDVVSADVTTEKIIGDDLDVESVSGDIKVSGLAAKTFTETVSGSIDVDSKSEEAFAESISGDIELRGTFKKIEVETVSGSIKVTPALIHAVDLKTTSGDITVSGAVDGSADLDCESHSGDIEIAMPIPPSATFDLMSFSGTVRNDFGTPSEKAGRYTSETKTGFTLGDGGARVRVESFSGDIELQKLP